MRSIALQLLQFWLLFCKQVRHFFLVTCSMKMGKSYGAFKRWKTKSNLLKFAPLCSLSIRNLIISLKHCLGNLSSIGCILKLKVLFGCDYFQDNFFLDQRVGWIFFVQDVCWWRWFWIQFGPMNVAKCVDDVWSCKTCSKMDDHGLSCLWLNLL